MNQEDFFIQLKNFPYDRDALVEIYKKVAHTARLKGLVWKPLPKVDPHITPYTRGTSAVIQCGNYQMVDPSKDHLSCNLLEFDYVQDLVSRLNFDHPILPENCDMLLYNPNAKFSPHTDHYAASTMMWPILPLIDEDSAPIHFHHRDDVEVIPGNARSYEHEITDNDIVYTHHYGSEFPTIFNSHTIHSIPRVKSFRVSLRLRIGESYHSILNKYKSGTLVLERPGDSNLHL